jgi:hypothetical protein
MLVQSQHRPDWSAGASLSRSLPAAPIHPTDLGSPRANQTVREALFSPPALVMLGDEYKDPSSYVSQALANSCYPGSNISRTDFSKFLADLGSQACGHAERAVTDLKVVYYPFGGADIRTPFGVFPQARDVFAFGRQSFGDANDFDKFYSAAQGLNRVCGAFSRFDCVQDLYEMFQDFGGLSGLGAMMASRIMATLGARITGISFFELTDSGEIQLLSDRSRTPWSSGVISFVVPGAIPGQEIEKRFWYLHCDVFDGCFLPENLLPPASLFEVTEGDRKVIKSREFRNLLAETGMICSDDQISADLKNKRGLFLETVRTEFSKPEVAQYVHESLVQSLERAQRMRCFFDTMNCQGLLIKAAHNMWDRSFRWNQTLCAPALNALAYHALGPAIRGDAAVVCDGPDIHSTSHGSHPFWRVPPLEATRSSDFAFGYPSSRRGSNVFIGRGNQLKSAMKS